MMKSSRTSIPSAISRVRWCSLVDTAGDGPLKICLGHMSCARCAFAQWLDLMDADVPTRSWGRGAGEPDDLSAAA